MSKKRTLSEVISELSDIHSPKTPRTHRGISACKNKSEIDASTFYFSLTTMATELFISMPKLIRFLQSLKILSLSKECTKHVKAKWICVRITAPMGFHGIVQLRIVASRYHFLRKHGFVILN